jgi:hypothetical protein
MRIEGISLAAVRETPVWEKMPGTGSIAQCCQLTDFSSAKLKMSRMKSEAAGRTNLRPNFRRFCARRAERHELLKSLFS